MGIIKKQRVVCYMSLWTGSSASDVNSFFNGLNDTQIGVHQANENDQNQTLTL